VRWYPVTTCRPPWAGAVRWIVAQARTNEGGDNWQLQPVAEAAVKALEATSLDVLADAGHPNGAQA